MPVDIVAKDFDPAFAEAWYNLGDLLDDQGRSEAAIESLRKAVQVAPDHSDAIFNLALLLQRKNQCAEAADYWRRYLAIAAALGDIAGQAGISLLGPPLASPVNEGEHRRVLLATGQASNRATGGRRRSMRVAGCPLFSPCRIRGVYVRRRCLRYLRERLAPRKRRNYVRDFSQSALRDDKIFVSSTASRRRPTQ